MSHLLPYHSCAGHLPTQEHFTSGQKLLLVKAVTVNAPPLMTASPLTVDQEFDIVSSFLLKRTKDMVNKYRQLLVREAQVRPRPRLYRCVLLTRPWLPVVHSRRVRRQRW